MRSQTTRIVFALVAALAGSVAACAPNIGDACINAAECPPGAVCDTTVPGGYCTEFECFDDGDCDGEAICIDFEVVSACMDPCSVNGDCRTSDGYMCQDPAEGAFGSGPFCNYPSEGE